MTKPFAWLGRHELATLVMWLLVVAAILAFVVLAGAVVDGQTYVFDRELLMALRNPADPSDPLGPEWVEEMVRDFTALGSMGVLILVTLSASAYLLLERRYPEAGLLLLAIFGGILLSTLLKLGFDRPRPELVPHMAQVFTSSFPSGHSKLSAVTYLTLGTLLARMHSQIRVKAYLLLLALLLTFVVGISRVYLGMHWPSDVLAGWVIGAAWALLCWLTLNWLLRHGQIERHVDKSE